MNTVVKSLLNNAEKHAYVHNAPNRTGWLIPVSQELIGSECDEDDVVEYIEKYIDEPLFLIGHTEIGWFIQEVVWSNVPSSVNPSYSISDKAWFKDDEDEITCPFNYFN
jgi:hypothetical protein